MRRHDISGISKALIMYRAQKMSRQILHLEIELESCKKERDSLSGEVSELRKLNLQSSALDERERNMNVQSANLRMTESEKRLDMLFSFVDKLLRNPVITKSMNENVPILIPPTNEYGGHTSMQNITQAETTEEK